MVEEPENRYPSELRRFAAAFVRARREALEAAWADGAAAHLAGLSEESRQAILSALPGCLEQVAALLETDGEVPEGGQFWAIAAEAWRQGVEYPVLGRVMRVLKRVLIRAGVHDPEVGDQVRPLCDLLEETVDEVRLRVNGYFHALAEERLRESEQLTRFLLNNTLDAILLVELDTGRIVMHNAMAVRLTGFSGEELEGLGFFELFPPELADSMCAALQRVAVAGTLRRDGVPLVGADGRRIQAAVQFALVRGDTERRLVQVSIRDTTSEAAALAAQEAEAAYLRAFVTETADAVMLLDADDRIRSWNRGAQMIFGYTADEVLNRSVEMLMPEELIASGESARLREILLRDGYVRNFETVRVTKNKRRIDVSLTRTAMFDPVTGEYAGASAVVRDVTERKRLERDMANQSRRLEVINRVLRATSRVLDRDQTFRTIAAHVEGLLAHHVLQVAVPEPDGRTVRLRVLAGERDLPVGHEEVVDRSETVIGRVLFSQAPLRIDDLERLEPAGAVDRERLLQGYRSALLAPLVYNNQSIGALAFWHRGRAVYDDDDLDLLGQLSAHFAVILENARRFEEERKRAAQFELLSRVGASAIANIGDVGRLMKSVVETIQTDFGYYDVAICAVDEDANVFRLLAQAGERRATLGEGFEQPLDVGIFGAVMQSGTSIVVDDVETDERFYDPSPSPTPVRSEMCVPIRLGPRVFGVLDVESQRPGRFDRLDRQAMEALASLLARCMEADENLRQMRMLQAQRQQIMEAVPSALLLLGDDLCVRFVNHRFCEFFGQSRDRVMGAHVTEILPESLLRESRFFELIEELRREQQPIDQGEVRYWDFEGQERYTDVRLRIVTEYETTIVVMLHDATNRLTRLYQLSMLQEIGEEMQRLLDVDRLLRAILTCVTAGPGFGFNRASLLMVDRENDRLVQRLEVGPENSEEAGRIWRDLGHKKSLREFLREWDRDQAGTNPAELRHPPVTIPIPPSERELLGWRTPLMLRQGAESGRSALARALREFSGAPEVLVVPLISQQTVIGLVVADNLFTGERITREDIRMLTTFANQASMALSNAQAYRELEMSLEELRATQARLATAERLAGIGSVAAHVAHEIRNPLVSIGGFARRVHEKADQPDYVRSRTGTIIREVERLERILRNVADFTAPAKAQPAPAQLNDVVAEVVQLQQPLLEERGIETIVELDPELPLVMADRQQIQQVMLNLVKNAYEAMLNGGRLWITTRVRPGGEAVEIEVRDTGPGIPADKLEAIFNPFFTSRNDGTGLGLAVCKKIVEEHGGTILVASAQGQGATFTVLLPRGEIADVSVEQGEAGHAS